MSVKVLIVEDNPVARSFLCRVVRESFSDTIVITEAGDLENARGHDFGGWVLGQLIEQLHAIAVGQLQIDQHQLVGIDTVQAACAARHH